MIDESCTRLLIMFTSIVHISISKHTNKLSNLVLYPEIIQEGDMKLERRYEGDS
jgi:hypothetical protein